jgi:crotonobetaine/carnitine-CoA ligase
MFEGYWSLPEQTAHAWRNLWMHTGDLGKLENGYLFFMDRAKDYLRCRGENISSFEIERTFIGHPAIAEVAIHAVGRQDAEDEIKATIVLREGAGVTTQDLCLWAIEKLPYFAVPRYFELRTELIKNPTGKVLKYRLRDEGVTRNTWDRQAAGIEVRKPKSPAT